MINDISEISLNDDYNKAIQAIIDLEGEISEQFISQFRSHYSVDNWQKVKIYGGRYSLAGLTTLAKIMGDQAQTIEFYHVTLEPEAVSSLREFANLMAASEVSCTRLTFFSSHLPIAVRSHLRQGYSITFSLF